MNMLGSISGRPAPATAADIVVWNRAEMEQEDLGSGLLLADLTDKQRQVLDLLIEHKTSKEIARLLDISPHTVDQRIQFAKEKLGARTRNEAAVAYRRLVETYGKMTYEESRIAVAAFEWNEGAGTQGPLPEPSQRKRAQSYRSREAEVDYQVVPELFDGRHGTLMRLGAIIAIAVLMVVVVLGGLAIFAQLSQLLAR